MTRELNAQKFTHSNKRKEKKKTIIKVKNKKKNTIKISIIR